MVKGEATLGGRRTTPVIFVAYLQQLGHVLLVLPCWKMMPYSFCRSSIVGAKLSANRELFLLKMASIQDGVENLRSREGPGV